MSRRAWWRTLLVGLAFCGHVGLALALWGGIGMLTKGRFA